MDPTDLPGYAGRIHDYFAAQPEHFRLMTWGQLELAAPGVRPDDAIQRAAAHRIEQLRTAQETGHLDPAWDPLDVLVFVNQIAMSWANRPDLARTLSPEDHALHLAARRAAIVAAVQRLFPATP
ncbi:hypothetical protein [Kitasatospora sp. NBC_00315]|uniref:hypothetical protein n=1 Tax=Kitasatospora sp. NBC_00315 TaxID=2975963 RepID=UPI003255D587